MTKIDSDDDDNEAADDVELKNNNDDNEAADEDAEVVHFNQLECCSSRPGSILAATVPSPVCRPRMTYQPQYHHRHADLK